MFCFVAGAQGDLTAAEAYEAVYNLIRYAKTLEGFVQAVIPPQQETRKVVLCFDSIESLNNAQWLLSLNGSQEIKGEGRQSNGPADGFREDAEAGGGCGDPGIQGPGPGESDHAGDDPHGEAAAGPGECAADLD